LDFAFLQQNLRLAIEIDGFGPHSQKISRTQFSDQWIRQNHLIIDGWKILRFSYDDVNERPRMCEQLVQQFMGRWMGGGGIGSNRFGLLTSEERDIVRLAFRLNSNITPADVCRLLDCRPEKARKLLYNLFEAGLLVPVGKGNRRIRCYRLSNGSAADLLGL